jgi:GNAT superfamily N-acetyltransferase
MLFASTALAARIERAEARLVGDAAAAAIRRRPDSRCFATPLAGGVAAYTAPGSPLNKVAGLGFAGVPDAAELDAVERAYAERGVPVQVELASLAEPGIATLLTRRGYVLANVENVLGRPLPVEYQPLPEGIIVTEATESERAIWLALMTLGFAAPDQQGVPSHESFPKDELERVMDDMAEAEGFVRYLATRAGEAAGGASHRLYEGIAQLCGAATLPEHRRHGVQTALLAVRLLVASRAGCDLAIVTTQPGSKSQENVQRRGFELLYTRAILVREP